MPMVAATVLRSFLAITLLLLFSGPLGTRADGQQDGTDGGPPCGEVPGDAEAVEATRALADAMCDCASATNHSDYVSCVDAVAAQAVQDGSLRPECSGLVVACAARSTCGKAGAVTCCRTDAHGNTTCSIKSRARF